MASTRARKQTVQYDEPLVHADGRDGDRIATDEICRRIDRRLDWYGTRGLRTGLATVLDERTVRVELIDTIEGSTAFQIDVDRFHGEITRASLNAFESARL